MACIACLPLPPQWGDQNYNDNISELQKVIGYTKPKRLYIYLTSKTGLSGHTLESLEKIIINTYFGFMDTYFDLDVIVIPPIQGCDPLSYLPDIQYVLSETLTSLDDINRERIVKELPLLQYTHLPVKRDDAISVSNSGSGIPRFEGAVLGGTFDHLHAGHKLMLTVAVVVCVKYMEIGVTDECMLTKKKFKEYLEPYEYRAERTLSFVRSLNSHIEFVMLRLVEPYANTKTSPKLHAIIVSPETEPVAALINKDREAASLSPLHVCAVSYVSPPKFLVSKDFKLSSTTLRELEANRYQEQQEATPSK